MKNRAASRLLKLCVNPAHIEHNVRRRRLIKTIGLRPKLFANGTHQRFEAPIINTSTYSPVRRALISRRTRTLTAIRCERLDIGTGGLNARGVAMIGNALDIEAAVKLTTKGTIDMHARIASLRQRAKFSGSAGSAEGCGTSRISSWLTVFSSPWSKIAIRVNIKRGI
jgi:hypothetical protein